MLVTVSYSAYSILDWPAIEIIYSIPINHLITKQYNLLGLQSSNLHKNTYSCFITFAFSLFSSKQKLTLCWSWTLVDSTASFVFLKINLSEPTCPLSRWILRFTTENMKQSNTSITVLRHFTHVYKANAAENDYWVGTFVLILQIVANIICSML